MKIIGWTYDADYHCIECKNKSTFSTGFAEEEDKEGNPINPLFSTDGDIEFHTMCGDCLRSILYVAGYIENERNYTDAQINTMVRWMVRNYKCADQLTRRYNYYLTEADYEYLFSQHENVFKDHNVYKRHMCHQVAKYCIDYKTTIPAAIEYLNLSKYNLNWTTITVMYRNMIR